MWILLPLLPFWLTAPSTAVGPGFLVVPDGSRSEKLYPLQLVGENQSYRASGLNLVVAIIVLWNTVYLERYDVFRFMSGPQS